MYDVRVLYGTFKDYVHAICTDWVTYLLTVRKQGSRGGWVVYALRCMVDMQRERTWM